VAPVFPIQDCVHHKDCTLESIKRIAKLLEKITDDTSRKGIREEVKLKRVLEKITRPKCFGCTPYCLDTKCIQRKDCIDRLDERRWLVQAIQKKAEHERKAKYFEKKIEKFKTKGVTPLEF